MKNLLIILLTTLVSAVAQEPAKTGIPAGKPEILGDAELAAQTIVIFNENDINSVGLANFYAEQRKIPPGNLIALKTAGREEITRREYDETIAEPLRKILAERGLWKLRKEPAESGMVEETKIRYAAIIRGIPLKIAHTSDDYEGDVVEGTPQEIVQQNAAAVDSEMSILGLWSRRISGVLKNPYFNDTMSIHKTEMTSQLLVSRLDGPSASDVRRMITDSIAAEKNGLRGFAYVDARGLPEDNPAARGLLEADRWLFDAAEHLRADGIPVILDNGPALFPEPYPMRNCALYLGWYNEFISGPFMQAGFQFVPGAVAVHIHSFSADSLRTTQLHWCGPLVARGAAATMGNVYEPYLSLTPNLNVFERRLTEGFTFAEAGHMSVRYLSWMTTWVGDPLYRPYRYRAEGKTLPTNEWDAYRDGVQAWAKPGGSDSALADSAKRLKSPIIYEGLGLLDLRAGNNAAAQRSFQQARSLYKNADDKIRTVIHEATAVHALKGSTAALAYLRQQIDTFDAGTDVSILRILEAFLTPPKKPGSATRTKPATQ